MSKILESNDDILNMLQEQLIDCQGKWAKIGGEYWEKEFVLQCIKELKMKPTLATMGYPPTALEKIAIQLMLIAAGIKIPEGDK